jgi:catecholate siderophore receptor
MGLMKNNKLPAAAPLAVALALAVTQQAHAYDASATDLKAVHVQGEKQEELESPKFTQPLLDTPQSVTIVPAELMQQQGVTTLRDALRNVPGISMQAGEGGVPAGDNLSLRGFSARTDLFVDGIRDFGGYSRDPFNLEQIEVIKGPASAQTGRGSTGGSINLSSKTAQADTFNNVGLSIGDDSLTRATADFNHPLGETTAFRVNLMGHDAEINGRDLVENQRWGVAPTLAFGLGTDTEIHFNLFHLEQDNVPDYGLPWVPGTNNALPEHRNDEAPVERTNWYGILERDYEKTRTDMATVTWKHAFNESVKLENTTRWGASTRDSVITAPRFASNNDTAINRAAPKIRDSRDSILANVTNLTASFDTGAIKHDLVAGLELAHEKSKNRGHKEDPSAPVTPTTDLYNPDPHGAFAPLIRDPLLTTMAEADSAAVYALDTLTLNPHWELSGGLRWDRFKADTLAFDTIENAWANRERTDEVLSGRVGVVFKPVENGSIYASYGTSFNPSAEGMSLSIALADVEPEKSRTYEVGTKWNLFDNRLSLTSALFRTEKTNARTPDPDNPEVMELTGKQRVDGFEIGVAGRITRNWTVTGGYAWLDGELLKTNDVREAEGNALGNTPDHTASLWTTYAFTENLEAGLGAQYVGKRWTNNREERQADDYALVDAMVSYRLNSSVALRLNGYNLANKEYIDRIGGGHYVPGAERTFMLSADFSF